MTRPAAFPPLRRHTDPPLLWISVVIGSLCLNGLLMSGARHYLAQTKPTPPTFDAIAVAFVTAASPANPRIVPARPPQRSASGATAKLTTVTATAPPVQPATTPLVLNPPRPNPSSAPTPARPTSTTVQPTLAPTPSTPAQASSTAPVPPETPRPPLEEPPTRPTVPPNTMPPDQVATSGSRLPDFTPPPDPTQNPGPTTAATAPRIPLKPASPARFLMQVQVLEAGGESDRAIVTLKSEPFIKTLVSGESGCILTPEIMQNFNQSIQFALTLNAQGKVLQAVPLNPGTNQSYENLATCALQTWSLDTAAVVASDVSAGSSYPFKVKVTLTQP